MKTILRTALAVLIVATLFGNVALAQGVMFVKNDKVGIGIADPTVPLDVVDTAGSGNTIMARYANNGAPLVQYEDTVLGVSWFLTPLSNGDFSVTKGGTGGPEMLVQQDGRVLLGPGAFTSFNLAPNGDLTIEGTLTQNSRRAAKQDFKALDGRDVLARVADLELLEWSYKEQGTRHFGPMAEDFHAVFGLGVNGKGLAPGDVAGVALKAVQGLNQVVEQKNLEIEQLSRELAELRALVESLASR